MGARVGLVGFLLFLTVIGGNQGARILGVFPFFARSHYILGSTLMKGFAEAGHDVTIIAPFTEKNPPKGGKWNEIMVDNIFDAIKSRYHLNNYFS